MIFRGDNRVLPVTTTNDDEIGGEGESKILERHLDSSVVVVQHGSHEAGSWRWRFCILFKCIVSSMISHCVEIWSGDAAAAVAEHEQKWCTKHSTNHTTNQMNRERGQCFISSQRIVTSSSTIANIADHHRQSKPNHRRQHEQRYQTPPTLFYEGKASKPGESSLISIIGTFDSCAMINGGLRWWIGRATN